MHDSFALATQRRFLALAATATAEITRAAEDKIPFTGIAKASLKPFNALMTSFVRKNKVPGTAWPSVATENSFMRAGSVTRISKTGIPFSRPRYSESRASQTDYGRGGLAVGRERQDRLG